MDKLSDMTKIRIIATPYMQLCMKCNHPGLVHTPEDHHDSSRKNRTLGKIGKCAKCNCKQFIAPKEKK